MQSLTKALRSPGAMRSITHAAPSRLPGDNYKAIDTKTLIETSPGYVPTTKPERLDRLLDKIVRASGSTPVFTIIQLALWGWAFAGVALWRDALWQVLISDVQAIFSYAFDSLLMRQQFNGYYESLQIVAEVKSRGEGVRRMFVEVVERVGIQDLKRAAVLAQGRGIGEFKLPEMSRWAKAIRGLASIIGHVGFVSFYWATIVLWLAFGPVNGWSNQWQLDINSATSALMVFIFSFLAILRERHADYVRACVDAIYRVDSTLELKLRLLTNSKDDNPPVDIPPLRMNHIQRAITYYADIVGALTGVAFLIIVFITWLAIGPVLHFDTNWWLLIGTYAGLIGLIDGFVLRNIQTKLQDHEEPLYTALETSDLELFSRLNIPPPRTPSTNSNHSHRTSRTIGAICGHELSVLAGLLLVCGLLIGASLMRWNETGQLLCNIPPSVVESFFMIILITGHNAAEERRRADLRGLFERRVRLVGVVDALGQEKVASKGTGLCAGRVKVVQVDIEEGSAAFVSLGETV